MADEPKRDQLDYDEAKEEMDRKLKETSKKVDEKIKEVLKKYGLPEPDEPDAEKPAQPESKK